MGGRLYIEGKKEKESLEDLLELLEKWVGDEDEQTISGLNLNGGTATSGKAGADVFTIPAAGRIEILCVIISMRNCITGATITVRAYADVDGVEDEIFNDANNTFVKGTDPDGIMVISGHYGANAPMRFEMHSNNAADTNVDVPYKAIWRELE